MVRELVDHAIRIINIFWMDMARPYIFLVIKAQGVEQAMRDEQNFFEIQFFQLENIFQSAF